MRAATSRHGHHVGPALGHEVARHAGQRSHAVGPDHLLDGGAAFGQVLEKRQPLGRTGVLRVVEAGVAPGVRRVHPFTPPRRGWRTAAPAPSP